MKKFYCIREINFRDATNENKALVIRTDKT